MKELFLKKYHLLVASLKEFVFFSGMTALESWCLAMIALVFEALLAYVLVLLQLFKRRTKQVKTSCTYIASSFQPNIHLKIIFICLNPFSQVNDSEDAEGREEERNWKIELILFSWVIIVTNPIRFK